MAEETTYYGLLEDLENYLKYQRDEGMQRLEVDRAVLEELTREPEPETAEAMEVAATPIPEDFTSLAAIADHVSNCRNCGLCQSRNLPVVGMGNDQAPDILFIDEAPGEEDDSKGIPAAGKAGRLLGKMVEAMGYTLDQVYITNIVKCRPKSDRKPVRAEMDQCLPYLRQQIKLLKPKVIVGLGGTAMEALLGRPVGISRMRGVWNEFEGIKLMPTLHPSYLLRDSTKKKEAWSDLKMVLKELGKEPPPRK